jgi:glycosyltransferase involved in cell wall biosynthesis
MASSIQMMKMCNAFAANGHEVILYAPNIPKKQYNHIDDVYSFYYVKNIFIIKRINFLRNVFKFFSKKFTYSFLVLKDLIKLKPDIVYGRVVIACALAAIVGYKVRLELHNKIPNILDKIFFQILLKSKNLEKIVVVTNSLKLYCMDKFNISEEKVAVIPNGADEVTSQGITKNYNYKDRFKAGYIGNLYQGKGMEIISEVAHKMPEIDFIIIGGTKEEIHYWKQKIKLPNVLFHGFVPPSSLQKHINMLDCCLLPNQAVVTSYLPGSRKGKKGDFGDVTCPLKMFQYMAHKKPIIASDLPILREVLNEQNAVLVPPDDIDAWVDAVNRLKDNNELRETIANNAYEDFINNYTWIKRAQKVLL